jgi:hypothetical protein
MPTVQVPVELLEAVAALRFPPGIAARLQVLIDRVRAAKPTEAERVEYEALAELSERMAGLRAEALRLLERSPA